MKRALSLLLAAVLTVSVLGGCGGAAAPAPEGAAPAYIEEISEIHRTEPYVYSQMIAGKDAASFGVLDTLAKYSTK